MGGKTKIGGISVKEVEIATGKPSQSASTLRPAFHCGLADCFTDFEFSQKQQAWTRREVCREHLTARTHTHIFLVRTSHVMTARVAQDCQCCACLKFIPFWSCLSWMSHFVRSLRFSLHQPVLWRDLPHHLNHLLESEGPLVPLRSQTQRRVERYCELSNKKTKQLCKVSTPCLDDYHFKKEELESGGELPKVCSQIVLKCLYLARIGRPDILWSVNKLARSVTRRTGACDKR